MLSTSILFVKTQLEEFFSIKEPSRKSMLKVASLAPAKNSDSSAEEGNTLNLSIINIEEAESMAHRHPRSEKSGSFQKKNPAIYLNVYLLFSTNFDNKNYMEGLHWLSLILQFFQQHTSFSSDTTGMPKGIDKLNFELVNTEIDNMSRFWGALGANYQPSVVYRMRMIMIDGEAVEALEPSISEPSVKAAL